MPKVNMHLIDRGVRIAIGLVLLALAFIGPANKWFLVGLVPLVTGSIGWCPLYTIFGFSTCPLKDGSKG